MLFWANVNGYAHLHNLINLCCAIFKINNIISWLNNPNNQ